MPMTIFDEMADLVEHHYIFEAEAGRYAGILRLRSAELAALMPEREAVNTLLHQLIPDRHLSLRAATVHRPAPHPPAAGIAGVQRRLDGVAVVTISPHLDDADRAAPYIDAMCSLAVGAERLVLDLRACGGGDTDTVAMIHGWLLGAEPVLLGWFEHRHQPTVEYRSRPGRLVYDGPVDVLTSHRTFSGGEDLAYVLQAHRRARVIGEPTAGGAHPVEHFTLTHGLICQIPVARSVIARTGGNWEGVGVTPDIRCPADDALRVALTVIGPNAHQGR